MADGEGLSELGRAALEYVRMGFAVVPLRPRSKEPATRHGLKDWTDDESSVRGIWAAHPDLNVGIVCGAPSGGLVALDLDSHGGGPDGYDALREWEAANGPLPETCSAVTGSGGLHLLFRAGREVRPSANPALAVDVRGDGSYIVAPPSVHPSGRRYEWEVPPDEAAPADADERVLAFVESVRPASGRGAPGVPARYELPDAIAEGGRNDAIFRAGASMRARGVDAALIPDALAGLNAARCRPPLPADEVARIAASVLALPEGRSGEFRRASGGGDAGGGGEAPDLDGLRGPRGGLRPNRVAQAIIERDLARMVDGAPAVWTGRRWEFGTRAINRRVLALADDAKKADKAEVVSYIMDKAPFVSSDNSFDGRHYVQFSDATVDAMTGEVVVPTPEMYIVGTLPVAYAPDMGPNLADEFLWSLAGGDPDVVMALSEIIGACMCSQRTSPKSPMLIGRAGGSAGKASNGKSTFINWLRSILGTGNVSSLDIATLGMRFQAQRVLGKLANLGDDIPDSFLESDQLSNFKKLVTGDSIYSDVKQGEGFEFRPSATMVFSMNAVPRLSDTTEGVIRRLYFVPFRRRFSMGEPGFDPDIAEKLARPEVLRRGAMIGLSALGGLVARGDFTRIPDMDEEIEEVRQDNDSVARWVYSEDVGVDEIEGKKVAEVYKEYSLWCRDAGERNPCSMRTFSSRLRESTAFRGVTVVTESVRFGGKTARAFFVRP